MIIKIKKMLTLGFLFLFVIAQIIICFHFISNSAGAASTRASKICFEKKYSKLTIHKKIQFRIKNITSSNRILFTSSNNKIASVHKNNGTVYGKRAGKSTIYVSIYQKGKRIKKLSQKLTVVSKNKYLSNAKFTADKEINPYNFTLKLNCSRILLNKEIQNSKLKLYLKNKQNTPITANFTSLSSNGKNITYTIIEKDQKKICPANSKMNGTYTIQSDFFSSKLSTSYSERLSNNMLTGYILEREGKPIKKAILTLKVDSSEKKYYTNENGYYRIFCKKKIFPLL